MSTTVLTAIYGDYEYLMSPVEQTVPVDEWIMVSDQPYLAEEAMDLGWSFVYEVRPHVHPNVAAKVPKYRPDLYTAAEYTVWIDSNAIIQPGLVETCNEYSTKSLGVAQFKHPHRDRITEEARISYTLPKYDGLPMNAQVAHYILNDGYKDDYGLWATGCIAMHHGQYNAAHLESWGDQWMTETVRWGFQDQLSHPYVCWLLELRPVEFPDTLFTSPYIHFGPHK